MRLAQLLRQTTARYQQAKRLVLAEHPGVSGEEFEQLVVETVQRLADQEKHLESHESEQSTVSPTATATHRRPPSAPGRRSPTS